MDALAVEAKVKQIISAELELPVEQVRGPLSFRDDLKADSLAVVELVLHLEDEFKIEIPEEDTDHLRTVQEAVDYVKARVK